MKSFTQFVNENTDNSKYSNTLNMLSSQDELEQMLGVQELEHLYGGKDKKIILDLLADRLSIDKDSIEFLDAIKEIGIIDDVEYKAGKKKILRNSVLNQEAFANEPIGIAMRSEPYRQLMELGFNASSSVAQLTNGTLVLEMPGKTRKLGIFQQGVIRRMLPPEERGIDGVVKRFDLSGSELYITALQWILDNIDFESRTLLTAKVTAAEATSNQRKREIVEKIYGEFQKLGIDRDDTLILLGGRLPYNLTDAKSILSVVKKQVAKGVTPFFGSFKSYESNEEVYDILSRPGVRWILTWSGGYLSVFPNSEMVWNNFDLDAHVSWTISNSGPYGYREIVVSFANEDEINEYAPIFNNYEPVLGINIRPRISR